MYQPPEIISEVSKLLGQRLSTEKEHLESVLIELDACQLPLAVASAEHLQLLYEKRKQMLWPKDGEKGLTELDRTTRLNGDVAPIERDYALLQKLQELVGHKMGLATILLRSHI